jgi:hypothetical protein
MYGVDVVVFAVSTRATALSFDRANLTPTTTIAITLTIINLF